MFPCQISRETIGKNLTAPRTVMCAKNHSRLTTHGYAIIVTWWGDLEASRIRNVTWITLHTHSFHNLSEYNSHFIIKEIAIAYEGCVDTSYN